MGPRTTHISSQKVDCCLDGVDLVSYQSRDYPAMIHYTKYSSYYLLYCRREDKYSDSGNGGGRVVPSTTHLSSQKVDLIADRNYG